MSRPAECLEGMILEGGWKVLQKVTPAVNATGGNFSTGYLVEGADKKQGYLKALDFSAALQSNDPSRILQNMTEAFNYERDLLAKCKAKNLKRVVMPLADGKTIVDGHIGEIATVCYIIFENADGDIRDKVSHFEAFDLAWCLRSLHHTAVGLKQLHASGIAHQDLKPSNVLVFGESGSKIADLGRASYSTLKAPFDGYPVPGDIGYAAPELFYGNIAARMFRDRCLADLYLLGSLFFFHFSGCSALHALQVKCSGFEGPDKSSSGFYTDIPYMRDAFEKALVELEEDVRRAAGSLTPDIMLMVGQLCDPDPLQRGDPRAKVALIPQYSLERYISRLDKIATKAELKLYEC